MEQEIVPPKTMRFLASIVQTSLEDSQQEILLVWFNNLSSLIRNLDTEI